MLAPRALPLALSVAPSTLLWRVTLVVGGSLLVALAAQVAVPLPFSPVPVTGQTYAVLVVGAALGARLGAVALVLYVLEGVVGLPVFAPGGAVGLARLTGPTGGYLVGFVVAAALVGALAQFGWDRSITTSILAMLGGEIVIYVFGLPWLAAFVPIERVLVAGLLPFIPGDLVKLVLAALTPPAAWGILALLRKK